MSADERLELIRDSAPLLLRPFFEQARFSKNTAHRFLRKKPIALRFIYLKMWLCLDWIARGGFDSLPAHKVTNDLLDHEYVLLATFFDGYLSNDERAIRAYSDITSILSGDG